MSSRLRGVAIAVGDYALEALAAYFFRLQRQLEFLAHHSGQEATHRMRLPAGRRQMAVIVVPRRPA